MNVDLAACSSLYSLLTAVHTPSSESTSPTEPDNAAPPLLQIPDWGDDANQRDAPSELFPGLIDLPVGPGGFQEALARAALSNATVWEQPPTGPCDKVPVRDVDELRRITGAALRETSVSSHVVRCMVDHGMEASPEELTAYFRDAKMAMHLTPGGMFKAPKFVLATAGWWIHRPEGQVKYRLDKIPGWHKPAAARGSKRATPAHVLAANETTRAKAARTLPKVAGFSDLQAHVSGGVGKQTSQVAHAFRCMVDSGGRVTNESLDAYFYDKRFALRASDHADVMRNLRTSLKGSGWSISPRQRDGSYLLGHASSEALASLLALGDHDEAQRVLRNWRALAVAEPCSAEGRASSQGSAVSAPDLLSGSPDFDVANLLAPQVGLVNPLLMA